MFFGILLIVVLLVSMVCHFVGCMRRIERGEPLLATIDASMVGLSVTLIVHYGFGA